MFFRKITTFIFVVLFFQFNLSIAPADECENFYEAIQKKDIISYPQVKRKDIGIFFDYNWNKKKNNIVIKRHLEKYPIVRVSLFEKKLKHGSIIKTIDGKDLSKITDNDIKNIILNSQSSEIEYFNQEKLNKIRVNSNNYNYIEFNLTTFFLNSINEIETKDGFFSIDYAAHFSQKRNDIKNESKYLKKVMCSNHEKIADKLFFPNKDIYLVSFEKDEDKTDSEEWFFTTTDGPFLETSFFGLAKIRSKFKLKNYPFDTQNLKIVWDSMQYTSTNLKAVDEPQVVLINPGRGAVINLNNYKENNYLKEWTIKDIEIYSEFYKLKEENRENIIIEEDVDRLTINLQVQRNYKYYIYKVIIPVGLILLIAWSVLWIPAKEIESRLTTSIVALLALIAYNFVFQDDIPKLNILTSLDKFVLLSYLFCAIPIFMTIFLSRFVATNQKRAYLFNRRMRTWGAIIYLLTTLQIFYQ